jgi:hypothetical protein
MEHGRFCTNFVDQSIGSYGGGVGAFTSDVRSMVLIVAWERRSTKSGAKISIFNASHGGILVPDCFEQWAFVSLYKF